jgi:hypothetical protein
MELKQHNNLATQYCDDEIGHKVPSNTKYSTNDYDLKKACETKKPIFGWIARGPLMF